MLRALFHSRNELSRKPGQVLGRLAARWSAVSVAMMSLLVAGCSFTTKQSTLDPKGPVARDQLSLFYTTVWVTLFIFVVVGTAMAYAVWRYRERPSDKGKPMPAQGHGNPLVEIGLIGASIGLLVIIAIPTMRSIFFTYELPVDEAYFPGSKLGAPGYFPEPPAKAAEEVLEVTAYGYQWWWAFDYKQFGLVTANELVLPAGKVIKVNLRARDVIHSFWLPKLAGKVDVIPGRANWLWMMADEKETGLFYGQCAEFCGEAHAYMLFRARVVTPAEFVEWMNVSKQPVLPPGATEAWGAAALQELAAKDPKNGTSALQKADALWKAFLAQTQKGTTGMTDIQKGASVFFGKGQCVQCHTIGGSPATGLIGPNLSQVGSRTSLAAGILDNLYPDDSAQKGQIDPAKQLGNLVKWISESQHVKPGNKMYYTPKTGLETIEADNAKKGTPFTKDDWTNVAKYLQTLTVPMPKQPLAIP